MKIYGNFDMGNPRRVSIFLAEKGIERPFRIAIMPNRICLRRRGGLPVRQRRRTRYQACHWKRVSHPPPLNVGLRRVPLTRPSLTVLVLHSYGDLPAI